jgi:putative transposase
MARPPRDTAAGLFHVYAHCVWVTPELYRDDVDRLEFLRHLALASSRPGWTCLAFCLMGSHYHLIVDVEENVLPAAMHSLNLRYARAFNSRHTLRGHVQFDRYGARRIHDSDDLLGRYTYVANNPVRAGIRRFAHEWMWSSYAGTIGLAPAHSFVDASAVLRCFEGQAVDPRTALRWHVEQAATER